MFGASATDDAMMAVAYKSNAEWVSVEPILEPIEPEWFISASGSNGDYSTFRRWEWVVIGAETGNSKHKTVRQREWVEEIVKVCKEYGTPVFMKEQLARPDARRLPSGISVDCRRERAVLSEEENIAPCLCGALPVKEMRSVMLGKLADGGYPVVQGRFRCPNCSLSPSWGMSYSVFGGRSSDENIAVWNKFIQEAGGKTMRPVDADALYTATYDMGWRMCPCPRMQRLCVWIEGSG